MIPIYIEIITPCLTSVAPQVIFHWPYSADLSTRRFLSTQGLASLGHQKESHDNTRIKGMLAGKASQPRS